MKKVFEWEFHLELEPSEDLAKIEKPAIALRIIRKCKMAKIYYVIIGPGSEIA